MKEQDISTALYGALRALIVKREYFYDGCSPAYSNLTEQGKTAALEIICLYAPHINEAIKSDLAEQSKKLVFSTLKE
jgi:hypothetical protein